MSELQANYLLVQPKDHPGKMRLGAIEKVWNTLTLIL